MLHGCHDLHVSKQLGVVGVEMVVDDKPIYCFVDVFGVNDELFWSNDGSLWNTARECDWTRTAAWSFKGLCASSAVRTELFKLTLLDFESLC